MKKFIICFVLCAVMQLVNVYATVDTITVTVNNENLVTSVSPEIVNGRTMLPMRAIFESLGAKVTWIEKDRLIFATRNDTFMTLQIENPEMVVQKIGNEESVSVSLDTAPYIKEGHTLVPVRAVAEALSAKVEWVDETRTVVITTEK